MSNVWWCTLLLVALLAGNLNAQQGRLKKARQLMEGLRYEEAIAQYERVLEKKETPEAIVGIANAHRKLQNYSQAEEWYARAVALPETEAVWHYYYGRMLARNGKCDLAQQAFDQFLVRKPYDLRRTSLEDACAHLEQLYQRHSGHLTVDKPDFNGAGSDLGPAFYQDGLVFGSVRQAEERGPATYDLYFVRKADIDPVSGRVLRYDTVEVFSNNLNSSGNEAIVSFSADGSEIFFTRNRVDLGDEGLKIRRLEIMVARKQLAGTWGEPTPLPFNNSGYSVAHPALSADGEQLYFSSDRPGGFGGKDIYVSSRIGDTWGEPINLGPGINTEGDELFPYYVNKELYFSSDGYLGLGGQDIFRVEDLGGGSWSPVLNMGAPVNSEADDFSFILSQDGADGYFTSNRDGSDDIFYFRPRRIFTQIQLVAEGDAPIAGAVGFLRKGQDGDLTTTPYGRWSTTLAWEDCVTLALNDPAYEPDVLNICASEARDGDTLLVAWAVTPRRVVAEEDLPSNYQLIGYVEDEISGQPVEKAVVTLTSEECDAEASVETDVNGEFAIALKPGCCYELRVEMKGFFTQRLDNPICALEDNASEQVVEIELQPYRRNTVKSAKTTPAPARRSEATAQQTEKQNNNFQLSAATTDDGSVHYLLNVYYDVGRSSVRVESVPELKRLYNLLNDNPSIIVEISSHTDSRGSNDYNQRLSQRRADALVRYLVGQGIEAKRLVAKGYGESRPVNHCRDGVDCSEEEYQQNRRTEFKVIGDL